MDAWAVAFWILLAISIMYTFVLPIWRTTAVWVPTYQRAVRRMLELAKVKPGELLIDLGSGDGRIVRTAAGEFQAKAIGVEINFYLIWWSRLVAWIQGIKHTRFVWKDLWSADVSQADVITLFLFDKSTIRVGDKLLREAKPSVRVVSHLWKLGQGWELIAHDSVHRVLVYEKMK